MTSSFNVFDKFLDGIFVINAHRKIVYCNEAAALLTNSSTRRLMKDMFITDVIKFVEKDIYENIDANGKMPSGANYDELDYELVKDATKGRVQVCVETFDDKDQDLWMIALHDVTIEDKLHSKYHRELRAKQELIEELEQAKIKVENYNKNLEKIISDRTIELTQANATLHAMMNSLGQGFVIVDVNGVCGEIYTRSCEEILECAPTGKKLWDVLKLKEEYREQVELWVSAVFDESLPFESLEELGPKSFSHSKNRHIVLNFFPIRNEEKRISHLVMVATDRTAEYKAGRAMEREREYSQMILKIVRNKDQFGAFINALEAKINTLIKFTKRSDEDFDLDEVLRYLHTFEGECGVFSVNQLGKRARNCQQILSPLKSVWAEDMRIVRGEFNVEVAKLAYNYEEFIRENHKTFKLVGLFESKTIEVPKGALESFYNNLLLSEISKDLIVKFEHEFLKEPVKGFLRHYEDVVQSVALKQGKRVNPIEFIGCDQRINGEPLRDFFEVMVHAFRNAVDHGIESVEDRVDQFKKPSGTITVEYSEIKYDEKSAMKFIVRDDGRGIDPERLRLKIKDFDKDVDAENLSDYDVIQYIFLPGFSSKDAVEEFSGRGVGMDAIKNIVDQMKGDIMVNSIVGQGSTLTVILPMDDNFKKPGEVAA